MEFLLTEQEIGEIIRGELDKNPDLVFYINNPYFNEFISLLIDGISKAIAANSQKVIEEIELEYERKRCAL